MSNLDVNKELKRMSKDFKIPEKEVVANWRSIVRFAWGKSSFKLKFLKDKALRVKNTNPRSMKRFPTVTKYKCEICDELFGSNEIELDHIESENSLKTFDDAEDFLKVIFFTSTDKLQVLCKDKKRKVGGKNQVVRFGCHSIKTLSERKGISFEEAKIEKVVIDLCKDDKKVVDKLLSLGVKSSTIPSTKKGKRELLTKLMKKDL